MLWPPRRSVNIAVAQAIAAHNGELRLAAVSIRGWRCLSVATSPTNAATVLQAHTPYHWNCRPADVLPMGARSACWPWRAGVTYHTYTCRHGKSLLAGRQCRSPRPWQWLAAAAYAASVACIPMDCKSISNPTGRPWKRRNALQGQYNMNYWSVSGIMQGWSIAIRGALRRKCRCAFPDTFQSVRWRPDFCSGSRSGSVSFFVERVFYIGPTSI